MCRNAFTRTWAYPTVLWIVLSLPAPACWGQQQQSPVVGADRPAQCILLRNGNVLIGQVHREGASYIVQQEDAALHLTAYQVLAVCPDVLAAYEYKRDSLGPLDAAAHLELAQWCIRQRLFDHAERELAEARRLAPTHPRAAIVERRLSVARQPASSPPPNEAAPVAQPDEAPAVSAGPADVREADSALVTGIPEDSMERFRRTIQPLLLNSCTTSGCHRQGSEEQFKLDRTALWRDAPHTLSVQNLAEALAYVDRDAPLESRLLTAAVSPHAGLATSPLGLESVPYGRLRDWVLHVCGHDRPPQSAANAAIASREPAGEVADDVISDEELDALLAEDLDEANYRLRPEPAVQRGLRPAGRRRHDPYDPEEFNRRFGTQNGPR